MADITTEAVAPQIPETLELVNGWLVQVVDEHTCGAGPGAGGGHEPGCGLVPIASVEHLFRLLAAEAAACAADPASIYAGHDAACSSNETPLGEFPECDCSVSSDAHIDDCD